MRVYRCISVQRPSPSSVFAGWLCTWFDWPLEAWEDVSCGLWAVGSTMVFHCLPQSDGMFCREACPDDYDVHTALTCSRTLQVGWVGGCIAACVSSTCLVWSRGRIVAGDRPP